MGIGEYLSKRCSPFSPPFTGTSIPPRYTFGQASPPKGGVASAFLKGIIKKELYTNILEEILLPFIRDAWPDGHKFMQDNGPKHTSKHAQKWIRGNINNWWKTPAESPNLNPIVNLWHELKQYIRQVVKVALYMKFWLQEQNSVFVLKGTPHPYRNHTWNIGVISAQKSVVHHACYS